MKKYLIIAGLIISTFVLSGCVLEKGNERLETRNQILETREGTLTIKSGEVYLLSTSDEIVNITSKSVNLDNYLKKKIKVTGMFSGDTLYVDKIENGN